jgi:hypothetical protein
MEGVFVGIAGLGFWYCVWLKFCVWPAYKHYTPTRWHYIRDTIVLPGIVLVPLVALMTRGYWL